MGRSSTILSKCLQVDNTSTCCILVSLQSDGEKVISGSYDHTLKVWDVKCGQCKVTLRYEHKLFVFADSLVILLCC